MKTGNIGGKLVGIIAALAMIVVVVASVIGYFTEQMHVHNEGIHKENSITEMNNNNTVTLNSYVASLKEQIGIANIHSAALDKVFTDMFNARFSKDQLTNPSAQGSAFSALNLSLSAAQPMNMPQVDLSDYDKVITFVQGHRDDYASDQKQLQSALADFNDWRASFPTSWFAGAFPDHWLTCSDDNGNQLSGQACEDYLSKISQPNGSNNGGGQNAVVLPTLTPGS